MDMAQLEYFAVVAKMEHMSKAAEALNISQPALSSNIKRLEEELNAELFIRKGRSIRLSEKGKLFLDAVVPILEKLEEAKLLISGDLPPSEGTVINFVAPSFSSFPGLITYISNAAPNAVLKNTYSNAIKLVDALKDGSVDFCISGWTIVGPGICSELLWEDEISVMVSPKHPLAKHSIVCLSELQRFPFASFSKDTANGMDITEICLSAGFMPKISFTGSTAGELIERARDGEHITLIPQHLVRQHCTNTDMKIIAISDAGCRERLRLYWHYDETRSEVWHAVHDAVLNYFAIAVKKHDSALSGGSPESSCSSR